MGSNKKNIQKLSNEITRHEKAIQLNPNDFMNYLKLYGVYTSRAAEYEHYGNANETKLDKLAALENAQKAYDLNPNRSLYALGLACLNVDENKKAIQLLSKAISINPTIDLYYHLAIGYHKEKNYEKALEFYQIFIKNNVPLDQRTVLAINQIELIATTLNQTIFPVPIDFSPLREVIPIGEDIVYSTLAECGGRALTGGGQFRMRSSTYSFITHTLITKNGIASHGIPSKKTGLTLAYQDWCGLKIIDNRLIFDKNHIFFFVFENSSIPLIRSLITAREKELELEFPDKRKRKKFASNRTNIVFDH